MASILDRSGPGCKRPLHSCSFIKDLSKNKSWWEIVAGVREQVTQRPIKATQWRNQRWWPFIHAGESQQNNNNSNNNSNNNNNNDNNKNNNMSLLNGEVGTTVCHFILGDTSYKKNRFLSLPEKGRGGP